jgi:hypothetical protein
MSSTRKTWREKLANSKDLPKVERIGGKLKERWGRGTVAIPAPADAQGTTLSRGEFRAAPG